VEGILTHPLDLYIKERCHCDIRYCVIVWRHDGASISESALVLGGLVISAKGKSARW
jgi:hypothetical protein